MRPVNRHASRALVVEDDETIRCAVEVALRREGYRVTALSDGSKIAQVMEWARPDVALLDVRLPAGPNGYEIARILRRHGWLPILFLTAADSLRERLEGFDAGGDDYLTKPFALEELLARVRALLRRAGAQAPGSLQIGDLVLDEAAHVAVWHGNKLELTRKEFELLAGLARHSGQVLSKEQLLENVWGPDANNPNVVEVKLTSLRRKLAAAGPPLVHTVRGIGYVLRP